jgi:hypothetical protein
MPITAFTLLAFEGLGMKINVISVEAGVREADEIAPKV